MRRKDKEIKDIKEIESIMNRCDVCRIALCENNSPYIFPVSFGYKDKCLYFHSAADGRKIDIIKKNNRVCFEFDIHNELIKSENLCNWDVKYYSVIGSGKAFFIEDIEGKTKALDIITGHYSSGAFEYQKNSVTNVTVIKVEIENLTGKKSGYL
jgi:nitroimidazol reductase NimA-like FMN-containing flavoprotein (pyridoxamine 5'-phosphate oxidase superfamily)